MATVRAYPINPLDRTLLRITRQKIRAEAEREVIEEELHDRHGDVVNGIMPIRSMLAVIVCSVAYFLPK